MVPHYISWNAKQQLQFWCRYERHLNIKYHRFIRHFWLNEVSYFQYHASYIVKFLFTKCFSASRLWKRQTVVPLLRYGGRRQRLHGHGGHHGNSPFCCDMIGCPWVTWCPQGGDAHRHRPESIWIGRQWKDYQRPSFGGGSFRYCHSEKVKSGILTVIIYTCLILCTS